MAYKIKDIYPSQTTTGDAGWPDGKPRNIQGGVQGTGTPFEEKLFQDYEGSRQALFDEAGITPSGVSDKVGQSDFVDALKKVANQGLVGKIFQSPTDGGLTEIQTRTVYANEVYEVRKTSDNSLATIYSDAAGTIEIVQNGIDNKSGSDGVVEFYVADGDYYAVSQGESNNFSVAKVNVVAVDSIADLLALPAQQVKVGVRYLVKGYHPGSDVGGGEFYWDASSVPSLHNGGTVIDPSNTFPEDWSVDADVEAWFTPEILGSGCFVRLDSKTLSFYEFGGQLAVYDQRRVMQQAIDFCRNLIVPGILWRMFPLPQGNPTVGLCLDILNNTHITLLPGARIELLGHDHAIYQMMRVWSRENVTISHPVLDGRRDLNAATGGEFGMGIDIRSSKNVEIINPITNNMWGDGIYIGQQDTPPENITITKPEADNCRRQGMSIVSGIYVTVDDPIWTNISGTAPAAGLDIEPNGNESQLIGIRINNPKTVNCDGAGVLVYLGAMSIGGMSDRYIDIEINGHVDYGSTLGTSIDGCDTSVVSLTGRILIRGPVWKRSLTNAFRSSEWSALGPAIVVENPTVIDCNYSGNTSVLYGSPFSVLRDTGSVNTYPIGNVLIDQPVIRQINKTIPALISVQDSVNGKSFVSNVHFRNPRALQGITNAGLRGYMFGRGSYSDDYQIWNYPIAGSATLDPSNASNPIQAPTTTATFTLSGSLFIKGSPDILVRCPSGHSGTTSVRGVAADAILGAEAGTLGLRITASPGAYLRLRPVGDGKFAIIENVGNWVMYI